MLTQGNALLSRFASAGGGGGGGMVNNRGLQQSQASDSESEAVAYPGSVHLSLMISVASVLAQTTSSESVGTPWFDFLVIFDLFHDVIEKVERHLVS